MIFVFVFVFLIQEDKETTFSYACSPCSGMFSGIDVEGGETSLKSTPTLVNYLDLYELLLENF